MEISIRFISVSIYVLKSLFITLESKSMKYVFRKNTILFLLQSFIQSWLFILLSRILLSLEFSFGMSHIEISLNHNYPFQWPMLCSYKNCQWKWITLTFYLVTDSSISEWVIKASKKTIIQHEKPLLMWIKTSYGIFWLLEIPSKYDIDDRRIT